MLVMEVYEVEVIEIALVVGKVLVLVLRLLLDLIVVGQLQQEQLVVGWCRCFL
jgi:hypothetical protein